MSTNKGVSILPPPSLTLFAPRRSLCPPVRRFRWAAAAGTRGPRGAKAVVGRSVRMARVSTHRLTSSRTNASSATTGTLASCPPTKWTPSPLRSASRSASRLGSRAGCTTQPRSHCATTWSANTSARCKSSSWAVSACRRPLPSLGSLPAFLGSLMSRGAC